jgi:choline dehydrogenase-like flavoprotein
VKAALEALGAALFLIPPRRRALLARRARRRPTGDGTWFTPGEARLVDALACLIVPSTDDVPGAREVEVMGPSVLQQIDRYVAARADRRAVYARGLAAIDELAQRAHGRRFVDLDEDAQKAILYRMQARHARHVHPGRSGLARRISWARGMLRGASAAAELYGDIVSDTLRAFYTSEVAWLWLGYDGPPMPLGYEAVDVPRPPQRVVPLTPSPAAPHRPTAARSDSADVVVVGSGAGGAVVAKELAEAGLSVIVIEAGRRFAPLADYLTDRTDFETSARDVFHARDELRDVYTTAGNTFSYSRVKGVGGSTLHYVGMSPRLHETDFATRTTDGVGDDWPITYEELEPYYTRVEYELGISGPDGANPFEPPRSRPYPTPAHPFNLASQTIKRGADKLGLHMVREPLALPSRDWQGRPACVGAGVCSMGCLISAKSSMDVTYVRKAEATGRVDLRTESMAREIELDDKGRATAVVYIGADGREHRVRGRAVVVAGNAVETPRLLMLSQSSRFPDGLANSSGVVGTHFMEHLAVYAFGLFEERVDPWRGTPSGGIIQDTYPTNPGNSFARGWTTLVTANSHWPYSVAERISGWGADHKARVEELFGRYICLATVGEELPDPRNRVVLDPIQKDLYGLPAPCLISEPRTNDLAMIDAMSAGLHELLDASGATEIWGTEYTPGMSSHYLGTCRMGNDPATSVVDRFGRSHDVENLFIADSSVFVTAGAANPSLTISALALRTSEAIVASFRAHEI